jgi:hypothetical protein
MPTIQFAAKTSIPQHLAHHEILAILNPQERLERSFERFHLVHEDSKFGRMIPSFHRQSFSTTTFPWGKSAQGKSSSEPPASTQMFGLGDVHFKMIVHAISFN